MHLTASGVSDGLVSLGLLDAPRQQDSVTLEEAVLFKLFDDNMNHSCSFSALQYLTLPLGVTEKGRLSFRLTVLQSLPALHSLLLRVRIIPQCAAEDCWWKHQGQAPGWGRSDSALTELCSVRGLRWLGVTGALYPCDHVVDSVSAVQGRAMIAALFGRRSSANKKRRGADSTTPVTLLTVQTLSIQFAVSREDEVESVLTGVAQHIHPAVLQQLTLSFRPREIAESDDPSDVWDMPFVLKIQMLLPLRSLARPRFGHTFHVTAFPLSPDCIEAIDLCTDSAQAESESSARPPVERRSRMMSQLDAAARKQPTFIHAMSASVDTVISAVRRRISAPCLWSITTPARTRRARPKEADSEVKESAS